MLVHPQFDPIAFSIGPVAVRWYGLMYLVAFLSVLLLGMKRLKRPDIARASRMTGREMEDLIFYGALGTIIGGRLGYVLFYKPAYYLAHPLEIFAVWQGGMAFHGGILGVIGAMWLYARWNGKSFWGVTDLVAPLVPIGLAAGRLGNFINGELWGRPTSVPWAMVFPQAGDQVGRHPSQLYQLAGEGLLLFAFMFWYSSRPRPLGQVSGMFLLGYGVLRFVAEFAREPDNFLGLLALGMSMGQWLCLPMIAIGAYLVVRPRRDAGVASLV